MNRYIYRLMNLTGLQFDLEFSDGQKIYKQSVSHARIHASQGIPTELITIIGKYCIGLSSNSVQVASLNVTKGFANEDIGFDVASIVDANIAFNEATRELTAGHTTITLDRIY